MVSLTLNPATIIVTVINVLIMFVILKKILFEKVSSFMDARTNGIESKLKEASDDRAKAKELKLKFESQMKNADIEGKKIVEEYKVKASKLSDEMLEEAKKEAALIRERARIDAEREMDKAKDEIRKQIIALSMLAAAKSVGGQLDEKKHHDLINDFINKVGV
ncbi:F0F1 ATP synthase subunit B [Clostridium cylindrosporum]|uniref:ATP synthase subunit b n=1 Tax=Clostridium cylindrosporum DSM 605 TaxID=1121307 RepID=A0A0J8DAA4_CLOCY|nr:F0F1 ATP synthase subunit B [Clostridium cylindrosporum]KMT22782.1 ATP synthase subunit b [Clostridium cylindrosporum DSM 605]